MVGDQAWDEADSGSLREEHEPRLVWEWVPGKTGAELLGKLSERGSWTAR